MTLTAVNWRYDFGTGDARPQLFDCLNDGRMEPWVLKLMGAANGELAADWIGSLLAHRVGVHCPDVDIVDVSPEALALARDRLPPWAVAGPAFASRYFVNGSPAQSDAAFLRLATPQDIGALYALDSWLDVLDRRRPDGVWNVLFDKQNRALIVLDFGKGLTSALFPVLGGTGLEVPAAYPSHVTATADVSAALDVCARIEDITPDELARLVASVPSAWLEDSVRPRIVATLQTRARSVRGWCEKLR